MPKTLTLIDGSGFIFRAYHVLPPMTDPQGTPVAAVYGFTNMLMKLLDGTKTDAIAVIFDASRQTFRNQIYTQYKAHRPDPPEDLKPQFALIRDAVRALSLPCLELEGYEADDLIAAYACEARKEGYEVTIVSSDKDLMQMIGQGVRMWDPLKQKDITEKEVLEKFGVGPEKVVEVLALIGDTSDNVPGVPGIGPKTAAELINAYGTLEHLLEHADDIKQAKRREMLKTHAEQALLSKKLVQLDCDTPLPLPLDALTLKPSDPATLRPFLEKHGFRSLLLKIADGGQRTVDRDREASAPPPAAHCPPSTDYTLIQDEAELARWIAEATAKGWVAFDTETDSIDATRAQLVGFSLCVEPGRAAYVPVGHREKHSAFSIQDSAKEQWNSDTLFGTPSPECRMPDAECLPEQIPPARALALLKPLLEDEATLKIGQNIKYDCVVMGNVGISIAPVDDSMLMSYCLNAGLHPQNMDELAQRYLGIKTMTYDEATGTGRARLPFAEVALEKARDYAAEDADVTLQLARHFKGELRRAGLLALYETIERPLIPVITAMEARGIRVDARVLAGLSKTFEAKMRALEEEIHGLAGHAFNIGSPKQLGEVLFDEMQLPGGRKGKTGAYATDIQVLEELAEQGHTLAAKVIEWRQVSKLKSTYTDALVQQIHPGTGRVHTAFSMAVAATGRLSSSEPNLQNIPIRTAEGKTIRAAFVAAAGYKLISADYSQIELRLLAHMADIPSLKQAFREGRDIHAITASQMFGVSVDAVTADLRRKAKTINFGIIYGISAHGLAVRLGIPRAEAAAYIERYFTQYPGIKAYMESAKAEARAKGYVTSLYGRRCHVPGINDRNMGRRQYAERAAINAPIQGTAADIIKRAMIAVHAALSNHSSSSPPAGKDNSPDCHMLLQVHDELVFEVKEGQEEAALALIKPAMEKAAHLSVPLLIEAGVGSNWGEIH